MSKAIRESKPKRLSLRKLADELSDLRERVADLEDARDLREAIRKNGDKPLIPWDNAKADLGLDV